MYCGESVIDEKYVGYVVAAAKKFKLKGLRNIKGTKNSIISCNNTLPLNFPKNHKFHFL